MCNLLERERDVPSKIVQRNLHNSFFPVFMFVLLLLLIILYIYYPNDIPSPTPPCPFILPSFNVTTFAVVTFMS